MIIPLGANKNELLFYTLHYVFHEDLMTGEIIGFTIIWLLLVKINY